MKKAEKKNKGFSLIELIVVVLIIGVIGIALAPQVMKWVDTSKSNTDVNNAEVLQSSVQAALADWQNDGGKLASVSDVMYRTYVSSNTVTLKVWDGTNSGNLKTGNDFQGTNASGATIWLSDYISQVTGDDYPITKYDTKGFIITVTNKGKVTVKCNAQNPTASPALVP
ncbi:MAG: prepilin-type N-terminal cleavage/methylation domain-containing protein [Lachnospiraceae bacterium]|nr:prepilin-type N-terminal cleavage/methylation domain-containing protein [Lachnospiraceae bacterium]